MQDLNRVQLIGHLGQDPEVKYTATGTARTTFSVATSAHWKAADGQAQEATEWTRCIAWGALAEICAQYVGKGSRVYVAGRLHTLRWHDAATGERPARDRPRRPHPARSPRWIQRGSDRRWRPAALLSVGNPGAVDVSKRPLNK